MNLEFHFVDHKKDLRILRNREFDRVLEVDLDKTPETCVVVQGGLVSQVDHVISMFHKHHGSQIKGDFRVLIVRPKWDWLLPREVEEPDVAPVIDANEAHEWMSTQVYRMDHPSVGGPRPITDRDYTNAALLRLVDHVSNLGKSSDADGQLAIQMNQATTINLIASNKLWQVIRKLSLGSGETASKSFAAACLMSCIGDPRWVIDPENQYSDYRFAKLCGIDDDGYDGWTVKEDMPDDLRMFWSHRLNLTITLWCPIVVLQNGLDTIVEMDRSDMNEPPVFFVQRCKDYIDRHLDTGDNLEQALPKAVMDTSRDFVSWMRWMWLRLVCPDDVPSGFDPDAMFGERADLKEALT